MTEDISQHFGSLATGVAVWIPFHKREDVPLTADLELGRTMLVFAEEADAEEFLAVAYFGDDYETKPFPAAGLVLMCDDYAPQIQFYTWNPPPGGGKPVETPELWKLKMWAQFVAGDEGYKETARRQSI